MKIGRLEAMSVNQCCSATAPLRPIHTARPYGSRVFVPQVLQCSAEVQVRVNLLIFMHGVGEFAATQGLVGGLVCVGACVEAYVSGGDQSCSRGLSEAGVPGTLYEHRAKCPRLACKVSN